jgi:hypothetical protein
VAVTRALKRCMKNEANDGDKRDFNYERVHAVTGEHAILITVLQAVAAAHIAAFKHAAAATAF